MNKDFAAAMRQAVLSTRSHNVTEATRVIQDALSARNTFGASDPAPPDVTFAQPKGRPTLHLIESEGEIIEPSAEPESSAGLPSPAGTAHGSQRLRKPLGEVLRTLREGRLRTGAFGALPGMDPPAIKPATPSPPIPVGAHFLTRSFACTAGTRSYKLYIPASAPDRPRGLVVMLHGCQQDPNDFAAGTSMNTVAEAEGLMVAYPGQIGSANVSSCWNWFNPADQMRDAGEPSIIAGITREITSEFDLDRRQVFVAGLSAGGAMAVVMGETYPDLYAAVGVHSGLAYRSANDVLSAFAAMRGDAGLALGAKLRTAPVTQPRVRTIVFHGSADQTVHSSNAERIVAAANSHFASGQPREDYTRSSGGRTYARTVFTGSDGLPVVENWLVHGVGHAWSGGNPGGSYTDQQGPDASAEMMRFFLCQPATLGTS